MDDTVGKVMKSAELLRRIKLHGGIVLQLRVIEVCPLYAGLVQITSNEEICMCSHQRKKVSLVSFSSILIF